MKQSIQLRLGQHLTMTPQLQQAIRLLQLSSIELQLEIQQVLESNLMLENGENESAEEIADAENDKRGAEASADNEQQDSGASAENPADSASETMPDELISCAEHRTTPD